MGGMSIGTVLGVLGAFGMFFGSIAFSTDNYLVFIHVPSFIMVIGGTLAATFISYEPRYVMLSLKLIGRILFSPKIGRNILKAEVGRVIRWAYSVQKHGLPALEQEARRHKDSAYGDTLKGHIRAMQQIIARRPLA